MRVMSKRVGIFTAVAVLATTFLVWAQSSSDTVFKVKVDMVVLSFTVTDSKTHYINGLKPSDFRIAALQSQIQEVARQSVDAAAERAVQESVEKTVRAGEAQLEQLREFWNRQLAESIEQAQQNSAARLEETMQQLRGSFAQDLQTESQQAIRNLDHATRDFQEQLSRAQENLAHLGQTTENAAAPFLADIEQRLRGQSDAVRSQIDAMETALRQWQEQMNSAAATAQADWQAHLDSGLQDAQARWHQRIEGSLEGAVQQAAERLTMRSQETSEQMERETGLRIAAMGRSLLEAGADAEQRMATLRTGLDAQAAHAQSLLTKAEAAAHDVEEQAEQLHSLEHTVIGEMERRADILLEAQAQKLDQRAHAALETWTAQFEPAMELAGRQVVSRLGAELEQHFGAQLEKVSQALGDLQHQTQATMRSVEEHGDSLRDLSEQTVKSAVERLEGSIARLEQDLQESARNAAGKWLAEIDAKATETTHTTFESLFKTAEWYEKKVQTQMHNTLEKGLEQASVGLRDKAGEISRLFAAEMDHYSRSYVDHTHDQIEEAGRDALAAVQKQSSDLSTAASRAIAQQAQNHTQAALAQFSTKAAGVLSQVSAQFDALSKETRAALESDSQKSQAQFRAALNQNVQDAVRNSRQDLAGEIESAKQNLRAESRQEAAKLQQSLTSLSDQSVENYRHRLESASETALLTAAAKLNQHSAEHLEALERSAEARLRDTCTRVFASVGESLRRRLVDLALQPLAEDAPADNPPAKQPDEPSSK